MLQSTIRTRSLWPEQPRKNLEAGPFAIHMESFPFKPVRPTDSIPAWPAFSKIKSLKSSKIERRVPGAMRQRVRRVAPAWMQQPGKSSMH